MFDSFIAYHIKYKFVDTTRINLCVAHWQSDCLKHSAVECSIHSQRAKHIISDEGKPLSLTYDNFYKLKNNDTLGYGTAGCGRHFCKVDIQIGLNPIYSTTTFCFS